MGSIRNRFRISRHFGDSSLNSTSLSISWLLLAQLTDSATFTKDVEDNLVLFHCGYGNDDSSE